MEWTRVIRSGNNGIHLGINELWKYRELIFLFSKRDLSAIYKQTILGPLWLVLQPLLTALAFSFIFGNLLGVNTGECPKFLFYYTALVVWILFTETLLKTSDTFIVNSDLFSKVYFPRLVMPLSIAVTSIIKFGFSLFVLLIFWVWYMYTGALHLDSYMPIILLPAIVFIACLLGISIGLILASLTIKYRDLKFLIQFGIQLLMYFSPVIFPLSLTSGNFQVLLKFNPMTGVIESMRTIVLNGEWPDYSLLLVSACFGLVSFLLGIYLFTRAQRNFIDII